MKSGKKARAYALFSESFTLFLREREKILGNTTLLKNDPQKVTNESQNQHLSKNQSYNSKQFLFHHKVKGGLHTHPHPGKNDLLPILSKKPLPAHISGEEGRKDLKVLDAIYRAANTGNKIQLT